MSEEKCHVGPRVSVAEELEKCESWCICTLSGVSADKCQIEDCQGEPVTIEDLKNHFRDKADLIEKYKSKCRSLKPTPKQ